jgi:hypothetical protein
MVTEPNAGLLPKLAPSMSTSSPPCGLSTDGDTVRMEGGSYTHMGRSGTDTREFVDTRT